MPKPVTIYHNPRCSKSRQTLALLEEHSAEFEVVEYLKVALTAAQLGELIVKLGCSAHDILRPNEAEYGEAGLSSDSSDEDIIAAIVRFPKLLERPIVVHGAKAAIGRPPESVLEIL